MSINPVWVVCDMEGFVQCDDDNQIPIEYKSAKSALTAAKKSLLSSTEDERWVFKLSHVVSREVTNFVDDVK